MNLRNLKFSEKLFKIEELDTCPNNLLTFAALFKIIQFLFIQ